MGMGKNPELVKRTTSLGRKRILILNHMDFDASPHHLVTTPKKRQFPETKSSLLEALPQEILIKILCGVDHDDLKSLFHVSKPIREAVVVAKKMYFEYSTPKKIPAFRCSLNLNEFPSGDFDEIECPNAPKHLRVHNCPSLKEKNWASICVSLFDDAGDV